MGDLGGKTLFVTGARRGIGLAIAVRTGRFFIDEDVLASEGVTDFGPYAVAPDEALLPDLFL